MPKHLTGFTSQIFLQNAPSQIFDSEYPFVGAEYPAKMQMIKKKQVLKNASNDVILSMYV